MPGLLYYRPVTDSRNPNGRRAPALPLPPPPDQDVELDDFDGVEHAYSTFQADITAELPRLPEVDLAHDVPEVELDERPLAGTSHLHRAGPTLPGEHAPRPRTQGPRRRPTPASLPTAGAFAPPPQEPAPRPKPQRLETLAPTAHRTNPNAMIAGRYRIVQRIGQGGMGKVYKVTHAHLSRTFALKVITDPGDAIDTRDLFYREARFASAMSHPNITQVVDFGEDEQVGMFMVMELVEGEPLNKILFEQKRLSVRMACDIALQVAEALHYIHQNNVVHCDIKTENILVCEDSTGKRRRLQIKLLDFGLARSLNATRTTATLSGTPHYVAPERIRGEPATPASDVYGLGILLYEMLTGRVPWDGAVELILQGHIEQQPVPPSELIEGGLDPAVEQLILRALAKSPADRHKDMAAFIYELRTVIDMLGFRRREKGPSRRIVIERSASARDALARMAFDGCRLPLALLSAEGMVLACNPAFARFVMGVTMDLENLPLRDTPLAGAWTSSDNDISRTLTGQPVRRILEISVDDEAEVRRLLLWLDPVSRDQVLVGVQPLEV